MGSILFAVVSDRPWKNEREWKCVRCAIPPDNAGTDKERVSVLASYFKVGGQLTGAKGTGASLTRE